MKGDNSICLGSSALGGGGRTEGAHIAYAGGIAAFAAGAVLSGVGDALKAAALGAFLLDVLPPPVRGLGIGIFRSAGDIGAPRRSLSTHPPPTPPPRRTQVRARTRAAPCSVGG